MGNLLSIKWLAAARIMRASIILGLTLSNPLPSIAAIIGFESTDITAYFNNVGAAKFSTAPTGGLSGSSAGKIDQNFTNGTLVTRASSPGGAASPIFAVSLFFQFATPSSDAGGDCLFFGITDSPTFDALNPTGRQYSEFVLRKTAFSSSYMVEAFTNSGGPGNPVSLQNGNWYCLSMDCVWNATVGKYDFRYRVNASDAAGNLGTQLISTTNQGVANPSLLYGFVASSGPGGSMGIAAIDNFSFPMVPEATPTALILLVTVWAAASRRAMFDLRRAATSQR